MMTMDSYYAQIWLGLKENYEEDCVTPKTDVFIHTIEAVEDVVQAYVEEKKECVTITPTKFIYTGGSEPGVIIGFIKYPRYPRPDWEIESRAQELAQILLTTFNQCRVTITTPKKSIMLSKN